MQTVSVRTTQNVFIQYPVASLGDRMAAGLIDTVIVVAYIVLVAYGMSLVEIDSAALGISVLVIPSILYHLLFEIFMDGQSPGKRQMKIKVVRTDGTPATIGNYLLRWLLRLVEVQAAQGMIAVITIAWNGRGQRLGDIAAGTTVVKLVKQKDVTAAEIFTLATDDYVPQFPGVIMLSDRDAELIQQALEVYRRHDNLQPAMIVTEKIKTRLGIQTDMTFEAFLTTILKDYSQLTAGK
ncbi:RDD family protein [Parachryseolinea silvisoli]|uniref:RDD family protein n=1 Tax=Parachryseolinea silvisoli TaxID=2873601 RepID=UPI00226590AC|nr:RDD family protein [Parachryseolinea silvisoli]MCD9016054.1 RDD family protein [Parachryseolinea silvisoli]